MEDGSEDGSEAAVSKKRKKDINPSSVTWTQLKKMGLAGNLRTFLPPDLANIESKLKCESNLVADMNRIIMSNCTETNEEFSLLCCGNVISHIVEHLQEGMTKNKYRAFIAPSVKIDEDDARHNKKSEYSIIRITNERTVVVVELKESVSLSLYTNEKELAQLLLEIHYQSETDNLTDPAMPSYTSIVGVLADSHSWHILC